MGNLQGHGQGSMTHGSRGPAGPVGPAGADGAPGADGADGQDGTLWFNGSGAPGSGLGPDGSFYIDTDSGDYYRRVFGAWTLQGNLTGPAGSAGPAGVDGADGANGVDGAPGPAGTPGADGIDGASAYQIWLDNGNTGSELDFLNSLVGATGPAGSNGVDGADGAAGPAGPTGPAGAPGDPGEPGTDGVDGTDGADGVDGAQWFSGVGGPGVGLGVDGDFYFDTSNGLVYRKASSAWSVIANLTGPAGADGTDGVDGAPGPGATHMEARKGSTQVVTTGFADVTSWDPPRMNTGTPAGDFTFNQTNGVVTFSRSGVAVVSYFVLAQATASNRVRLALQAVGFDATGLFAYEESQYAMRNTGGQNIGSAQLNSITIEVSAADFIALRVQREGATCNLIEARCSVTFYPS